jgi:hypothetical protein
MQFVNTLSLFYVSYFLKYYTHPSIVVEVHIAKGWWTPPSPPFVYYFFLFYVFYYLVFLCINAYV